jgi:hypothetical protein
MIMAVGMALVFMPVGAPVRFMLVVMIFVHNLTPWGLWYHKRTMSALPKPSGFGGKLNMPEF